MTHDSESVARTTNEQENLLMSWEVDYPIFRNFLVMRNLVGAVGCSTLFLMLVLGIMMVSKGRSEGLPEVLGFAFLIGVGLLLLFLFVTLVFFGGKMRMRVDITEEAIHQTIVSRQSIAANLLALVAGLLGGGSSGATTASAGLLAASQSTESLALRKVREIVPFSEKREIQLRNKRRIVMQIFAPEDRFEAVVECLEKAIADQSLPG